MEARGRKGNNWCVGDNLEEEVSMTEVEVAQVRLIGEAKTNDLHGVWWKFQKEVLFHDDPEEVIESFEDQYPEWIQTCTVDDAHHCSSTLCFVRHGTGENFMGYSVVHLPQCSGREGAQFFLYPGHLKSLWRTVSGLLGVETEGQLAEDNAIEKLVEKEKARPSSFDVWQGRWKTKQWYLDRPELYKALEELEVK